MASTIKVDNVQNQPGTNIVNKCGTTVTVGAASDGIRSAGNNLQASDGGNLISQSGTDITLGASGDTINLASGASQSGFGRTGTVDWVTTPKVTGDSPVTAATGSGYFLNTTAGAITINLPAGAAGSIVSMADYAGTWQTNNVTVSPNGAEKIGASAQDAILNTEGQSITLVYVDSTQGWINTMDSTSNVRGAPPNYTVQYLVVAGGAGGGTNHGGGGGAGGYRTIACKSFTVTGATGYPITVGAGGPSPGATPPATPIRGGQGSDSIFSSITSAGGGGGAGTGDPGSGRDGGSGGGGGRSPGASYSGAGAGNTPATPVSQGNPGSPCSPPGAGGGGGGAAAAGGPGGPGGIGSPFADLGPLAPTYGTTGPAPGRYFSGGGGGYGPASTGGSGGGGTYALPAGGNAGTVNTGGGSSSCLTGGSGIVIIRHITTDGSPSNAGGDATAVCGSDTIRVFTGPGTFTA